MILMKKSIFVIDMGQVANRIKKLQKQRLRDTCCRYVIYVAQNKHYKTGIATFDVELPRCIALVLKGKKDINEIIYRRMLSTRKEKGHCECVALLQKSNTRGKKAQITLDVEMADYYRIKKQGQKPRQTELN